VVEQERGLELQVNIPESTLATILPIVIVIVAASVLKIELFSARLEARLSELLRDLRKDVFSTKLEAGPSESVRTLVRPLVSELARPRVPTRP
jgi:hypothetical protein